MGRKWSRRDVLKVAGAGAVVPLAAGGPVWRKKGTPAEGAVVIASANGMGCVERAYGMVSAEGAKPVRAAVMGVAIQEADPNDHSVGYGGLPNEEGVVQLDSACMDGPTHNAGAVACIENIKHPAQVADLVRRMTDHVLIVGKGATRFAVSFGFKEEDLLTDAARERWVRWRANRSDKDDWLWPAQGSSADVEGTHGTIHCSVLSPGGDVGCCTTTSGLSWKVPGRVGDSPLIGCGLYCDNGVGSAGATGRGESAIHSGGSWLIVERMRAGDTPEQACLYALQRVTEQAEKQSRWQASLWKDGRPAFQLRFYAVRKDGLYGSASMLGRPGGLNFAVCDHKGPRKEAGAVLHPS